MPPPKRGVSQIMHLVAAGKPQKISFNCSHIFEPNSVGHLKNWDANAKPNMYDLNIFFSLPEFQTGCRHRFA
jgi:hypothetical protein